MDWGKTALRASRLRDLGRLPWRTPSREGAWWSGFDSTIGAASVLVPFGGAAQTTPTQVMAALLPVGPGRKTDDCSVMAWGFEPRRMERDPFRGRPCPWWIRWPLMAAGCDASKAYLPFRSILKSSTDKRRRWGKPLLRPPGGPVRPVVWVWPPSAARTPMSASS